MRPKQQPVVSGLEAFSSCWEALANSCLATLSLALYSLATLRISLHLQLPLSHFSALSHGMQRSQETRTSLERDSVLDSVSEVRNFDEHGG